MTAQRNARRRPPRLDTQWRRRLRDSARPSVNAAVEGIVRRRHATTGLTLWEQGYASMALAWLAGGWTARAEPETETAA